jgi:Bacterial SH3 domain
MQLLLRKNAGRMVGLTSLCGGTSHHTCTFTSDLQRTEMTALGYRLGKFAGTIVATFISINKAVYAGVGLIAVFVLLWLVWPPTIARRPKPPAPQCLKVGINSRVTDTAQRVNIRRSAGYKSKSKSDVLSTVPSGDVVFVIGGPERSDDLTWWRVRWDGYEGWMAEYNSNGQLLEAIPWFEELPALSTP